MAKETFEVSLSDAEWRERLSEEQYQVLRKHGTERAGTSPLDKRYDAGSYLCAGCGQILFPSDTKFDSGTRLAELLGAGRGWGRQLDRFQAALSAYRSALQPVRRPSRPRVQGRPAADRPALLHERRRDEVRAEEVGRT